MPIDEQTLIQHLQSLAPFVDASQARRAFDATLEALRSGLTDDEADWIAIDLGPELAAPLQRQRHAGELTLNQFHQRVGRCAKLERNAAKEQAQVVCRALAELLPQPTVQRLKKHLPALAALFSGAQLPRPVEGPYTIRRAEPGSDHTLAGGRAGSDRPLSEGGEPSAPASSGAGATTAHEQSIAVSPDPHADTKLSSTRGLTQEREGHSLATAGRGARKA